MIPRRFLFRFHTTSPRSQVSSKAFFKFKMVLYQGHQRSSCQFSMAFSILCVCLLGSLIQATESEMSTDVTVPKSERQSTVSCMRAPGRRLNLECDRPPCTASLTFRRCRAIARCECNGQLVRELTVSILAAGIEQRCWRLCHRNMFPASAGSACTPNTATGFGLAFSTSNFPCSIACRRRPGRIC